MKSTNSNIYQRIDSYLEGRLSDPQVDELWEQLLGDDDALDYLETTSTLRQMASKNAFIEEYESDENEATVTPLYTRIYQKSSVWLSAAAILIAAIAGISYFTQQQSVPYTAEPVQLIEYEIYRSAEVEMTLPSSTQDIMATSAMGEHDQAIQMYNNFVASTDTQPTPDLRFLEASLYYNSGDYTTATQLFAQLAGDLSSEDRHIRERSIWFAANGYLHLNKTQDAQVLLQQVIQMDGSYSRIARNLLSELNGK